MSTSFKIVFLGIAVLVGSCAQVGTLTGGPKDLIAPKVEKVNPPANTVNFKGNSVSFEFDEFIKLNNVQQNVYLVPADAKPDVVLSNKTVTVSWKETLRPNTTYTLYLNGAIADTHEGNDSLMTYVFSTGDFIDSIAYSVRTVDAWTGKPMARVMVALFEDSLTQNATYYGQSDAMGEVKIEHIKAGDYFLRAFTDEDRNLKISEGEWRGFNGERIKLFSSINDSLPVRMFKKPSGKINFKVQAPGIVSIAGLSLNETNFSSLDGSNVEDQLLRINTDSVLYLLPSDTSSRVQLLAKRDDRIDTLRLTVSKRDHQARLNLKSVLSRPIRPADKIEFEVNDPIVSVDREKIKIVDALTKDSIPLDSATIYGNRIVLFFQRKGHSKVDVLFKEAAYASLHKKQSAASTMGIELKSNRELGAIKIKTWTSNEPLLLFLYRDGNFEQMVTIPEEQVMTISELEPGNYRFKVVEDVNRNGKWDVGDLSSFVQPEFIHEFEGPSVRANWETEVQLSID